MCTKKELNTILDRLNEAYKAAFGEDIVKVLLYGSYSRGDFNSDSDVDVVAIVKGDRMNLQQKLKTVWEISSDLEIEFETIVSPTVIPYDEFEKYKNDLPYYKNIEKEGVEISA